MFQFNAQNAEENMLFTFVPFVNEFFLKNDANMNTLKSVSGLSLIHSPTKGIEISVNTD